MATAERALSSVNSPSTWRLYESWCWFSAHVDLGLQLRFMDPEEGAGVREIESEMRAKMGRLQLPALER